MLSGKWPWGAIVTITLSNELEVRGVGENAALSRLMEQARALEASTLPLLPSFLFIDALQRSS